MKVAITKLPPPELLPEFEVTLRLSRREALALRVADTVLVENTAHIKQQQLPGSVQAALGVMHALDNALSAAKVGYENRNSDYWRQR